MREHVRTFKIYFIRYFMIKFNGGILIISAVFAITLRSILHLIIHLKMQICRKQPKVLLFRPNHKDTKVWKSKQ